MDLELIASDIVKAVNEHQKEFNPDVEPLEHFQTQYSDYLRDYMPYDMRQNEPRDYEAEREVRSIVERILEEQAN